MTSAPIVIVGKDIDNPMLTLRESSNWELLRFGNPTTLDDSAIGRLVASLQALPDIVLAGQVAGKRLMEVQINGTLAQAADGVGQRAFSIGERGIKEHARLFDADHLNTLINAAAVWRIASVIVAQKHLHDINLNLTEIKGIVNAIGQFQRDEQRSKLVASYQSLFVIGPALIAGERSNAVRMRLENIDAEMSAIQLHLQKILNDKLDRKVEHSEMFGFDKLATDLFAKVEDSKNIINDYILASMTRLAALQLCARVPGEQVLIQGRAENIRDSVGLIPGMCEDFSRTLQFEVANVKSKSEPAKIIMFEIATGSTAVHAWIDDKLPFGLGKWGNSTVQSLRGQDGSLTPSLDAMKLLFQSEIAKRASDIRPRAEKLIAQCDQKDLVLSSRSARYLVEWENGAPGRIQEIAIS